jgi:hypothetical protein
MGELVIVNMKKNVGMEFINMGGNNYLWICGKMGE